MYFSIKSSELKNDFKIKMPFHQGRMAQNSYCLDNDSLIQLAFNDTSTPLYRRSLMKQKHLVWL